MRYDVNGRRAANRQLPSPYRLHFLPSVPRHCRAYDGKDKPPDYSRDDYQYSQMRRQPLWRNDERQRYSSSMPQPADISRAEKRKQLRDNKLGLTALSANEGKFSERKMPTRQSAKVACRHQCRLVPMGRCILSQRRADATSSAISPIIAACEASTPPVASAAAAGRDIISQHAGSWQQVRPPISGQYFARREMAIVIATIAAPARLKRVPAAATRPIIGSSAAKRFPIIRPGGGIAHRCHQRS